MKEIKILITLYILFFTFYVKKPVQEYKVVLILSIRFLGYVNWARNTLRYIIYLRGIKFTGCKVC